MRGSRRGASHGPIRDTARAGASARRHETASSRNVRREPSSTIPPTRDPPGCGKRRLGAAAATADRGPRPSRAGAYASLLPSQSGAQKDAWKTPAGLMRRAPCLLPLDLGRRPIRRPSSNQCAPIHSAARAVRRLPLGKIRARQACAAACLPCNHRAGKSMLLGER